MLNTVPTLTKKTTISSTEIVHLDATVPLTKDFELSKLENIEVV
jgi:hypothetical protein